MLRAGYQDGNRACIVAGLTEDNILRLKDNQPIAAPLRTFGVDLDGKLFIFYGKTHLDVEREIEDLIGPETARSTDPRLDQEAAARSQFPKILLATVGLPRSGKTTWARSQSYPIVNPDSIRLAIHGNRFIMQAEPFVWAVAKAMVRSLFLAGHDTVILDATNTTRKRRDEWKSGEWGLFFKEISTSKADCHSRASAENDVEIGPVIERMAAEFQPLEDDERRW